MKTPISLIIDDAAPLVHIYHAHIDPPLTRDGRPLSENIPNDLLFSFCDIVERFGIRGKFSVVPYPACRGRITDRIEGFPREAMTEWLETTVRRLSPYFAFCPEILTHYKTMDLKNGGWLEETEREWSLHATAEEMTDYISLALSLCRDAGILCTGVTSPWDFGIHNEKNYVAGIAAAFERVFHEKKSWYFLHCLSDRKNLRPWVEWEGGGQTVVSVPSTVDDSFWQTIDKNDCSPDYIRSVADAYITEDGRQGSIIRALDNGCFPILCTHLQSMFSNGNRTGLRALSVVAERIERLLSDRVEWVDFNRQTEIAIRDHITRPSGI